MPRMCFESPYLQGTQQDGQGREIKVTRIRRFFRVIMMEVVIYKYAFCFHIKVHISSKSTVADHCSVYALSDPNEAVFKQDCDHQHEELCDQCQSINEVLKEIGQALQDTTFRSEEERDETLYLYEEAQRAIQEWKSHHGASLWCFDELMGSCNRKLSFTLFNPVVRTA